MKFSSEHTGFIEWSVASRTHPDEVICGDAHFVKQTANGVLICVIDGLGHGPEAAEASRTAIGAISHHSDDAPEEIIALCHDALKATRGAVLSLAMLDSLRNSVTWVGIGNVEGMLLHPEGKYELLPLRGGIVGCRMPSIQAFETPFSADDLLLMYSDGIASHLLDRIYVDRRPAQMVERIISNHAKNTDDAVVLVAGYHGNAEPKG